MIGPIPLGGPGDVPVPADYLGLGRAQLAVFRPGTRRITLLPAAAWFLRTDAGATIGPLLFGQSGDVPVPGDYLGLGHAQIAVFRPRTGEWLIRTDAGRAVHIALGKSGDVPVPGDYAGTGRLQIAIYRPTTGEWFRRAASGAVTRVQWGAPGDLPVPAPYPREFGIRAVVDYFDPPD